MAAGITAQYGFLYQRYVFIKMVLENVGVDKFFTYEGIDDVDVLEEHGIYSINFSNNTYVQVKSGNVSRSCWAKVIGNWLLIGESNSTYKIVLENKLLFKINEEQIIDGVCEYFIHGATKAASSIANRVYKKFINDKDISREVLKNKIAELSRQISCEVISLELLKQGIEENFKSTYCQDIKVYEMAKKCRCERFIDYINSAIDEEISKKNSFTLRFVTFMDIINKVSSEISDGKYTIDIGEMKKRKKKEIESLMSSEAPREVRQLRLVNPDERFIINELLKELLYRDFRNVYEISDGTLISNIEETAFFNYEDTKYSLVEHSSPKQLFEETVEKYIPLSIVNDSPLYRHGCYVFLTSEESKKITWGEEHE